MFPSDCRGNESNSHKGEEDENAGRPGSPLRRRLGNDVRTGRVEVNASPSKGRHIMSVKAKAMVRFLLLDPIARGPLLVRRARRQSSIEGSRFTVDSSSSGRTFKQANRGTDQSKIGGRTVARLAAGLVMCFLASAAALGNEGAQGSSDTLAQGFRHPPRSARPDVYWAWLNGCTDRAQLTRELEEMKAKGIGGALIFDVGARDPDRVIPAGPAFLGPESLQAIGHAVREAKRLGLRVGLVTSSSWNAGGPWVRPEHASMGIYYSAIRVSGPKRLDQVLPLPPVPKKAPTAPDGSPLYCREVAVLALPEPKHASNGNNADKLSLVIGDVASVVDLSSRVDARGRLQWDVPPGRWRILRFVAMNTGQGLLVPSPNSAGLSIDHFSAEATRMHFQHIIDRLQGELGSLRGSGLEYLYLCSYELRGSTWTPRLLDEFRKRRGYDMTAYLPVLAGSTIKDPQVSQRFHFDFDKTLCELLAECFYGTAREMSHRYGLLLCAEAGGPGPPLHKVPVDALKAQGMVDIPRGEFWNQVDIWVVKETACAAHIYGKPIVDMEAFTSWRHWQDGPGDLLGVANRALCEGTNHFTLHTFAHNPPKAGLPGWVYFAGEHVNTTQTWWPKARPFFDYLARCSYLLQQGLFVADVCYYYGDQGYNFVPPKHVDPSLGPGYDYDVTNADVLLNRMSVRDGRIVLPDGMSYAILVLPEREDMDLDVLRKLEQLVRAGATVVGRKPTRTGGLTDWQHRDRQLRELADRLWGPCDGQHVKEHRVGKGRIVWGRTLREVLAGQRIGPDFLFTSRNPADADLDYIHRRTQQADIYFVWNKRPRWEEADCTFRVSGKAPELWDPDTGQIQTHIIYDCAAHGTRIPLRLPPMGALFVVLRRAAEGRRVVSMRRDGESLFPVAAGVIEELPPAELFPVDQQRVKLIAWKDGSYGIETAEGSRAAAVASRIPPPIELSGPWEVRFPEGWGAPRSKVFAKLISWTDDADYGVRHFSGIAAYHHEFELPDGLVRPGSRLLLDLGRVSKVADVWLNGQHLGILWKPPFRVDITAPARPGKNRLLVEVANVWSNRLTGDANAPDGKRYCNTNQKFALSFKSPWKTHPLVESGLLGPVRVFSGREYAFELPSTQSD